MNEIIISKEEYKTICKVLDIQNSSVHMTGVAFGERNDVVFTPQIQMGKEVSIDGQSEDCTQVVLDTELLQLKIDEELNKVSLLEKQLHNKAKVRTYKSIKEELANNNALTTIDVDFIGDPCSMNELKHHKETLQKLEQLCHAKEVTASEVLSSFKQSGGKLLTWILSTTQIALVAIKLMVYTLQSILLFFTIVINGIGSLFGAQFISDDRIMAIKSYRIFNNNPSVVLSMISANKPIMPKHVSKVTAKDILVDTVESQPSLRSLQEELQTPKILTQIERANKQLDVYQKCKCQATDSVHCICVYSLPETALALQNVLNVIESKQTTEETQTQVDKIDEDKQNEQTLHNTITLYKQLLLKKKQNTLTDKEQELLHTINEKNEAFKYAQENMEHTLESTYL